MGTKRYEIQTILETTEIRQESAFINDAREIFLEEVKTNFLTKRAVVHLYDLQVSETISVWQNMGNDSLKEVLVDIAKGGV